MFYGKRYGILFFVISIEIILVLFFIFYKKYLIESKKNVFKRLYIKKIITFMLLFLSIFSISFSFLDIRLFEKNSNKIYGSDIVFVLDVSKSMNVMDFTDSNRLHSRLNASKMLINQLVVKNPNNRYGLIIFAGESVSISPLTNDIQLFLTFLSGVDHKNLLLQGSSIKQAIFDGLNRFPKDNNSIKSLVLITDGGDESLNIKNDDFENHKKVNFFVVGVGTQKGGKIPDGIDFWGNSDYKIFNGEYVISKLQETELKNLAYQLNGNYFSFQQKSDLSKIISKLDKLPKKLIDVDVDNSNKQSLSYLFIFLGFIFFVAYLYIIYFYKLKPGKSI